MSIFVTGDTHGVQNRILEIESKIPEGSTIIVCGDWGHLFFNDKSENEFLDDLERRQFIYCFVDGNHENFPAIYSHPVENWNGGLIHRIRSNIVHLMRGEIFEIENKKILVFGGAYSVDRAMRVPGLSWWPQELPNDDEYKNAQENLAKADYKVDYILTHTAPLNTICIMGYEPSIRELELNNFFQWISERVECKRWYFGHWHQDRTVLPKHTAVFRKIHELK